MTLVDDPAMPAASPADPSDVTESDGAITLRNTALAVALNRFGSRVETLLQRLADKDASSGILMEQDVDMNHQRITNVGPSYQPRSLIPLSMVEDVLGA